MAEALLTEGTAQPGAVFLSGSNAGGYTALQAACVPKSPLTAVTAISAIIDPVGRAVKAPRFQHPHVRALAGPAGPVLASRVQVPVLLVHGRDDHVAPAVDAETLASDLRARDPSTRGCSSMASATTCPLRRPSPKRLRSNSRSTAGSSADTRRLGKHVMDQLRQLLQPGDRRYADESASKGRDTLSAASGRSVLDGLLPTVHA